MYAELGYRSKAKSQKLFQSEFRNPWNPMNHVTYVNICETFLICENVTDFFSNKHNRIFSKEIKYCGSCYLLCR